MGEYDDKFSTEKHNSKKFKKFNISRLNFGSYNHLTNGFEPLNKYFNFIVSSTDEKIVESLLNVNKKTTRNLGDSLFFRIDSIEIDNKQFEDDEIFELITPIIISINSREYIYPSHKDFKDMFFKNLIRKCGEDIESHDYKSQGLEIIGDFTRKKNVHNNNCSVFKFKLKCPKKLIKIGLLEGFGIHNAQGNGFVK